MANDSLTLDANKLTKWQESTQKILKDIGIMDSQVETADLSDLGTKDKETVKDSMNNGKNCIDAIKEFNEITSPYISPYGFIKFSFGGLNDKERRKVMKSAGDTYEKLYKYYLDYWCGFEALADFHYVTRIGKQPYVK